MNFDLKEKVLRSVTKPGRYIGGEYGEIIKDTLLPLGYNEKWLERKLEDAKLSLREVFLMTVTESGETKIIRKDGKDK